MAKDRFYVCGTLCLCMCFFMVISIVRANEDSKDRHLYRTSWHIPKPQLIEIKLLEERYIHDHHKRDVSSTVKEVQPFRGIESGVTGNKSEQVISLRGQNGSMPNSDNGLLTQLYNQGANGHGERRNNTVERGFNDFIHDLSMPLNTPTVDAKKAGGDSEDLLPNKLTLEEEAVDEINSTDLAKNNITSIKKDTHVFYNSSIDNTPMAGKSLWVDMDRSSEMKVHELLSNSHRRAATVKLSFEFPFYGRYLKNVTVATGGFLYTGNYVHSWLAATQYIAPLMANFDTSISNKSFVKYVDNGTTFTVEWENVALQDKPTYEFTFQTSLHKNGDIVFVYKSIPVPIADINEQYHPVKIGLSDAYILDRTIFYVRRKTIYEYHRVSFSKEEIRNWTVIYLKALPSCLDLLNCQSCLNNNLNLNCTWCPSLRQCSTGQDRNRQFWLDKSCDRTNITALPLCAMYEEDDGKEGTLNYNIQSKDPTSNFIGKMGIERQRDFGVSGSIAIIVLITMVAGVGFWTAYAYKNPHTTSGQILIRYRPSQWRWRRGEARYTAATIHM